MYFNKTIPELDVTSLEKTVKFYQTCGFKIEYERKENKFVFMSLGEIQFMFCELKEINKSNFKIYDADNRDWFLESVEYSSEDDILIFNTKEDKE